MLRYLFTAIVLSFSTCLYSTEQQCSTPTEVILKAPDLSDENFLGAKVGIRPYRKTGIRIEKEYLNNKLIVHNYGYGGSGLTLCWGGAKKSIELISNEVKSNPSLVASKKVAVLGAGVIGLSTAYELLKLGYEVTIYAENFSPNLTSDIAAGIWSPPSLKNIKSEEKRQILEDALEISRTRYLQSANSDQPEFLGIQFIDDYIFKDQKSDLKLFGSDFNEDIRAVEVRFDNGLKKTGTVKRILSIDGKKFLENLFSNVKRLDASIVQRHIENIQDILDLEENIVVNCTSFGSEKIFNDKDFLPIRGHILLFRNVNHLDYMAFENVNDETSIWVTLYPRGDELIICGTFEEGVREEAVDQEIVQKMLENTRSRFSSGTLPSQ